MTNLEQLTARRDQIEKLVDAIDGALQKIYDKEKEQLADVLARYFTPEKGDEIEFSHSSVNVRRKGQDRYNSFLDLYLNDEWTENGRVFTGFYISNSSFRTNSVSDWAADRFTSQAYYTRLVVDFQDDILAEMNQICEVSREMMREVGKPKKELEKEARNIREVIKIIEKEARLKALMSEEGLEVKGVEKKRHWNDTTYIEYPDFQVKFDWTIHSVRGIKVDKVSASGKSADIIVKVKRDQYSQDGSVVRDVLIDQEVKRVRMENIDRFLNYNF
jgi:hypothetical protein